jgi:tetratricopeptide (TPR) repeat protein
MTLKRLLRAAALMALCGCAAFEIQSEFNRGRQALIRGDANESRTYFESVAATDPNFRSNDAPFREGIWTYIGRSLYQSGQYAQAKVALEKALAQHSDDDIGRLYLGLTLARLPAAPAKSTAFSAQDISFALHEGIEPERVAALARERGVAFDVSSDAENQLRKAGADTRLLDELKKIRAETRSKNEIDSAGAVKELFAALTGLRDNLSQFIATTTQGKFWDPGGELQKEIGNSLALLGARNPDWSKIIASGEWLGQKLEEEIDRARRDESENFRRLQGR